MPHLEKFKEVDIRRVLGEFCRTAKRYKNLVDPERTDNNYTLITDRNGDMQTKKRGWVLPFTLDGMVYDIDDMEEKLPHIIKSNHIHIKRVLDVHIGIVNEDGASDGGRENLKKQIKRLELEVSALSEENSTLIVEKSKLQTDMIQLRRRITELNTRNKTVEEENEMLCEENEFLREMADKTKEIKKSDFSKKRMVQYNETTRGMGD